MAGGLVEDEARYALWLLALGLDYAGPAAGYRTPGLGRSRTGEWTIEGRTSPRGASCSSLSPWASPSWSRVRPSARRK